MSPPTPPSLPLPGLGEWLIFWGLVSHWFFLHVGIEIHRLAGTVVSVESWMASASLFFASFISEVGVSLRHSEECTAKLAQTLKRCCVHATFQLRVRDPIQPSASSSWASR